MRISVLGTGAQGTALASHVAQLHDVMLWGCDANFVAQMAATHISAPYPLGMMLRASLHFSAGLQAIFDRATGDDALTVIASPVVGLADLTRMIIAHGGVCNVIWLRKGSGPETSALPYAIVADVLKVSGRIDLAVGVLLGPSLAKEVAQGLPCAMTVVSISDVLCKLMQRSFHYHVIRVYVSDDPADVEVGGAIKNVLAVATGAVDGLGLGLNVRVALVTRGLAGMTCLELAFDGRLETFMGLTGASDLLLTAIDDLSCNRTVRMQLAQGRTLDDILYSLGHAAEGACCTRIVAALARAKDVNMLITFTVCEVLFEGLPAVKAVECLL